MAELRYTYLLDVKDRASRLIRAANEQIARSVTVANRAMEKQGAVAASASRQVQTAGARQSAEWKQVARAAQTAERSVAQAATQASTKVSRALERQVAAQRKAGASYAQIARQQKASGTSARETAAAIEQSAAREQKAMTASSGAARKHSGVLGGLRSQLKGFGGMAAGLGATFAAFKGLDFLRESVNDVEDLARATIKLQAITGQDAKTASSWLQVAKQRGISTRQLSMAFITLEKNQVKAAAGSKTQAAAFKALGITQEQLRRSNPQQLIERVADGMKRLGPGAQRAAAAQQLLGRGGQLLIATLSGGSQKLRDQLQLVQKYGAALNEKGVRNAAKLVAEQRKLDLAMLGLKVTVGQAIIPYLTKGGQALSRFVAQMRSGTGTGGQVRKVLEQVGSAAKALATSLGPVAKVLAQAFGPAARVAGTAIRGMTQIIRGLVGVVKGVVGVVTNLIRGDFAGAWRSVKGVVRSALSGLGGLVKTLMAPVYTFAASAVRKAVGAVGRLGGGIAGAIRGAIGGVAKAAASVGSAIWGGFKGTVNRIVSLFRSAFNAVKSIINSIKSAAGSVTSLPGKILDAVNPFGRRGGVMHSDGFRRYQAGGVVPAMVSPGEMIVHQGRAGMVPGAPVAADNVAMMLPVGAAVLTGDGQRMVSQGASIGEAIARQAPHYATGGWVRTGATVYNDPPPGAFGSLSGGYAELGTATRGGQGTGRGYIARALGMKGELPANFALDVKIHGRTKRLRKRDRGYGQGTPSYSIDIWKDSWSAFGINSSFKGPALIRPVSGAAASSTGGRPASSTYSPRGRLITSGRAMQLGYQAGVEGGSLYPVYASVRDAATYNRQVTSIPGGASPGPRAGAAGGPPNYGGSTGPMVTWEGKRMRSWMAHALAYARQHGWKGHVVEALRSIATQRRYYAEWKAGRRAGPVAVPGRSRHQTGNAVDVAPAGSYLSRFFRGYRGMRPKWYGPGDKPHYSDTGHRRGGLVRALRFQTGGVVGTAARASRRDPDAPVAIGKPTIQPEFTAYRATLNLIRAGLANLLKAGAHDNTQIAQGLHQVDVAIQRVHQVSYGRLVKMADQLRKQIASSKTDRQDDRRLKGVLRLVSGEMGRRIGLLAEEAADIADPTVRAAVSVARVLKRSKGKIDLTTTTQVARLEQASNVGEAELKRAIAKLQEAYRRARKAGLKGAMTDLAGRIGGLMTQLAQVMNDARAAAVDAAGQAKDTARDQAQRRFTAGQTIAGVDPGSSQGLLAQYRFAGQQQAGMQQDDATLRAWLAAAQRDRNADAVKQLVAALAENAVKEQEGLAAMADLARQGLQAQQTERIAAATSEVGLAQGGLQTLGLQQQLAGTYDNGGGQARADYINQRIIPAIQREITALQQNGASAQDIQQAQNDLLQAQLDAQEAIKQNTEDTVDSLKNLGGSLGFDFGGARFTDALVASGVGA